MSGIDQCTNKIWNLKKADLGNVCLLLLFLKEQRDEFSFSIWEEWSDKKIMWYEKPNMMEAEKKLKSGKE
jgi:hypothetical protein